MSVKPMDAPRNITIKRVDNLDLEGIVRNLARDMSSCYDDHKCYTMFNSHHKQQSYGPKTNLLQGLPVTLKVATARRLI